jgi:heat shock protein HtpX
MPRVYVIPEEAPNAFATGRSPEKAAVAATQGLLRLMSRDEIEAVMAHELGHVKNRDTLIMTVAATLAGALSHLATMALWFGGGRSSDDRDGGSPLAGLVGVIVAPFAAMLIQMAISRSREFLADEASAQITGNPMALANALKKLESYKAEVPMHHGSPATAHLFIVNPFTAGGLASLFSTHPSTQQRIERLEEMARSGGGIRPA